MTGWVELRALEKGFEEREHREWERARFIAHLNYLVQPVWGKGQQKEKDPRRFYPFPWDKPTEKELHPEVVKVSKKDIEKLNRIFEKVSK